MTKLAQEEVLHHYINGEWKGSSTPTKKNYNPADITDIVSCHEEGGWQEAEEAIEAAEHAFVEWGNMSAPQRGAYLQKAADRLLARKEEVANVIVREMGKTYAEAEKETGFAAGILNFYGNEGRRLKGTLIPSDMPNVKIETTPEPLGAVLAVTPWNFPLSIPCWKSAPALVAGNTVVLKTSSETPATAVKLMEIYEEAGIPAGVINHVLVPGRIVPDMIGHEAVKAVSFTGSNEIGTLIHSTASEKMKRVHLEMGGKNPLLVMEDADLEEAVDTAIKGGFGQTGQACTATGRIIVHSQVKEQFVKKLVEETDKLKLGNGMESGVHIGPQVNEQELSSTLELIESAKEEGAVVLTGGHRPEGGEFENGYFVEPAVIDHVKPTMRIAQEEVFGPALSILEADSIEEAIDISNQTKYGLTASICTKNLDYITKAHNEMEAGLVKANMPTTGTFYQAPFGGYKQSSTGVHKELGSEAVHFYLKTKTRYIKAF